MTINYAKKAIELTSAEMKKAQKYGSDMYKELCTARRDNPGFKVVEVKAKKSKNDFSDLTMKKIKAYVEKHGTEEQKKDFAELSKCHTNKDGKSVMDESFLKVKAWFLNEFELKKSLKENREKIEEIYAAAKAKAAA